MNGQQLRANRGPWPLDPPVFIGMHGAIGCAPQKTRGMPVLLVLLGLFILFWLIVVLTY